MNGIRSLDCLPNGCLSEYLSRVDEISRISAVSEQERELGAPEDHAVDLARTKVIESPSSAGSAHRRGQNLPPWPEPNGGCGPTKETEDRGESGTRTVWRTRIVPI